MSEVSGCGVGVVVLESWEEESVVEVSGFSGGGGACSSIAGLPRRSHGVGRKVENAAAVVGARRLALGVVGRTGRRGASAKAALPMNRRSADTRHAEQGTARSADAGGIAAAGARIDGWCGVGGCVRDGSLS